MEQNKDSIYTTITGQKIDLDKFNEKEKELVTKIFDFYLTEPEWSEFSSYWTSKCTEQASHDMVAVCQDLEARLGIEQGKVALPDYRDYLSAMIKEKFRSYNNFCKITGIDQGQLSCVLRGNSDFSFKELLDICNKLGVVLIIKSIEEIKQDLLKSPLSTQEDK